MIGSGGQWGANNSTSGVYAACMKLREAVVTKLGIAPARVAHLMSQKKPELIAEVVKELDRK